MDTFLHLLELPILVAIYMELRLIAKACMLDTEEKKPK